LRFLVSLREIYYIYVMRPYAIIICLLSLLISSCKGKQTEQEKFQYIVEGDWLIIAPDHKLENDKQREIYGKIQDSVIDSKALKLVRFSDDGSFHQVDHPEQKGKWAVSPEQDLFIGNGGDGFQDFKSKFLDFTDNKLRVTEYINTRNEKIKLVWHMKKIFSPELVKPEYNTWRKKATAKQSEKELRQRLSTILQYYASYYKLVADESIFFIGGRVVLPFNYYQHGMGILPYNPQSEFAKLFYDNEQAEEAYGYLNNTMDNLKGEYPSGKNYVDEYSMLMGRLAKAIVQ
jgi:hypothetical protein